MGTDYRKLCLELFGTDDEQELRRIAEKLHRSNSRNAGRKKKFTPAEAEQMERLQAQGVSQQEIARQFGTSRQVVGRYLTPKPPKGCTLRLTYMYRQFPCTVIDVDFLNRELFIQNKTDDLLHRAFGVKEKPDWADLERFLWERCFPESRGDKKRLLEELGLKDYDPWQIAEKTQGRMADDEMWLKFRYFKRRDGVNAPN